MSALEKLKKLQAIQFRYKEEFDVDQRLRAGLSAQQVKEIIPEAVVAATAGTTFLNLKDAPSFWLILPEIKDT